MRLAARIAKLGEEGALSVLARAQEMQAQGKDIVHLEIGDPDFPTPPHIIRAAHEALEAGYTHYPPAPGLPELRAAIARRVSATRGIPVDPRQVIVTPGSKPVMFYTIMALGEPGAEILCPNPGMPEFEAVTRLSGAKLVSMKLDEAQGFRPNLEDLARKVTSRTRLVMLISPHNPTGVAYTRQELEGIASVLRDRDCYVFSDEIYSEIRFTSQHASIAAVPGMAERTIISDGFSKTYAMTGWRLGYGVFPQELVRPVINLQRNSVSAAAAATQRAGLAALEGPQDAVRAMVAEYRRRRDVLVAGLRQIPGMSVVEPDGAFYVFAGIHGTRLTSVQFAEKALDEVGVALLSGTVFGSNGEGYVRLSYATSVEQINRGLERLDTLVRRYAKIGRQGRRKS